MTYTQILLDILAFGAIISGILVITSKNPVISVLFLISVFIHSASYLLVLGVGFVGLAYLIIYVGAITVLFLFVIMMINIKIVDLLDVGSEYTKNLPLGLLLTGLFFYEIFTISPINLNYDSIITLPFWFINKFNSILLISNDNLLTLVIDNTKSIIPSFENWSDITIFKILQLEVLGQTLYTNGFILLYLMGFVLFLGMFGPIVVTMNKKQI